MSVDPATQAPTGESHFVPYTIFPNTGMRILSATLHFTGSSILAYCVARRVKTARVASVNDLKSLSWPRLCVVIILVISWMFIFATGILIHGVGLSSSHNACSSGIFMCIWLYALTKVFIYAFLTEKVRVVWDIVAQPRLSSPVYLVCILVMLPFGAMPVMMTIGRIAFFQPNMACVIGLKPFASIALLGYDLFTNVFLNAMFLWPLLRSNLINPRLRIVARRTLVAAIAALATSATNVAIVAVLKHELGWVCLASCTTDVTLNALVIFWLTIPTATSFPSDPAFMLGQLSTQQPISSQSRADASVKAPIVIFTPTMVQQPEASLNSPIISKTVDILVPDQLRATEDHEYQDSTSLSGFPVSPTMASTSAGNVSIPTNSSGDDLNCVRRSIGLRSLGELFGLSRRKSEQEVEVHVSVVTQHDMELGGLGDERTNQDDGDSVHQTELASRWYE